MYLSVCVCMCVGARELMGDIEEIKYKITKFFFSPIFFPYIPVAKNYK